MTRITPAKELEQYDNHRFAFRKTSQDKAYHAFLNSIYDENGELNVVGGKEIPEEIVEICRVFDPMSDKEYLIYDVIQWGFFEDGSRLPTIHIQDCGVWKQYRWRKVPVESSLTSTMATGEPQRRQWKDTPDGFETIYDIPFTKENVNKLKKKCTNSTNLYVYNLGIEGRGGRSGKIGVKSWDDFINRTFTDLIEGTYLLKQQYETQLKSLKEKESYLNLREKMINSKDPGLAATPSTEK